MRRRRQAAFLTPDTVAAEGMAQCWHPLETILGFFDVDDLVISVLSPLPFNGDWEGRNGALIHATPRHEPQILRTFLRTVPVLSPFQGEVLSGWRTWCHPDLLGNTQDAHIASSSSPQEQPHPPCVMLTSFKDNNYILFVPIPPPLLPTVKRALFALLQAVYDIPLKWEPAPPITTLGVANLTITSKDPHLWRKGVVLSLDDKDPEWAALLPAYAPNARCVLQARSTPLLNDSLIYAMRHTGVLQNLRSPAWGLGSREYPKQWWQTPVANLLRAQDLLQVVTVAQFAEWVAQGRAANDRKACGCNHGLLGAAIARAVQAPPTQGPKLQA